MKTDQGFKNWLKENYSCGSCNKELFLFRKIDKKNQVRFIFYWQNKTLDPEPDSTSVFLDTGIEKVCPRCAKGKDQWNAGGEVNRDLEFVLQHYQKELEKLRKIPIPDIDLEKVIKYAKQTNLEKCSKCQNYSFFITENKTGLVEKFRLANNKTFCLGCFENFSEKTWSTGYKETKYFLYDLWKSWKNKDTVLERSKYEIEEKLDPSQKIQTYPVSPPPQNPNLERKDEKAKLIIGPVIFLVACFSLSLIFLTIFVFSRPKKKK